MKKNCRLEKIGGKRRNEKCKANQSQREAYEYQKRIDTM